MHQLLFHLSLSRDVHMRNFRWPALARIESTLPDEIHFITAEELHAAWPDEDVHGREDAGVRKWGAIFIIGMGWPMQVIAEYLCTLSSHGIEVSVYLCLLRLNPLIILVFLLILPRLNRLRAGWICSRGSACPRLR